MAEQQDTITRKAFVGGLPMDMKASEVVKRAKRAGIKMKEHDVYTVRYQIRKERGLVVPRTSGVSSNTSSSTQSNDVTIAPTSKSRSLILAARRERFLSLAVEDQLRMIVARVGTDRAKEIVRDMEGKLAAI